jgi:hypothetical protein
MTSKKCRHNLNPYPYPYPYRNPDPNPNPNLTNPYTLATNQTATCNL